MESEGKKSGGRLSGFQGYHSGWYPGSLIVIDTMNGAVLAQDTMPDGLETYMSPVVMCTT